MVISELCVCCFDCTERADNIPVRSVRGNCGGEHGHLSVDRHIEEWQAITDEVLHNESGNCRFVHLSFALVSCIGCCAEPNQSHNTASHQSLFALPEQEQSCADREILSPCHSLSPRIVIRVRVRSNRQSWVRIQCPSAMYA